MLRSFRRAARTAALASLVLVATAVSAQAAIHTYCVTAAGDTTGFAPACAALPLSTPEPSVAAAMTAAVGTSTTSSPSVIRLSPGTFAFTTLPSDDATHPVIVRGAGMGETILNTGTSAAQSALKLVSPSSLVSDVTIVQNGSVTAGLQLGGASTATAVAISMNATPPSAASGIKTLAGGALIDHASVSSTLSSNIADNVDVVGLDVSGGDDVTVSDSSFQAGTAVRVTGSLSGVALVEVARCKLKATNVGWDQVTASSGITSYVSSSLIDMLDTDYGSLVGIRNNGLAAAVQATSLFVDDSTIVGHFNDGFAVHNLNASTSGMPLPTTTRLTNTAIAGFSSTAVRSKSGTAPASASHITFDRSAINYSAIIDHTEISDTNTLPIGNIEDFGFVDAAGHDFRPRFNSPLVDPNNYSTYDDGVIESHTDLDGAPRVTAGRAGTAAFDTGAYEYVPIVPTVSASVQANTNAGAAATFTAVGADANGGETAQLTYTWTFSDGSVGTGASVVKTVGASGVLSGTVKVTDPTARTSTFTAATAITPAVKPKPPVDTTPPADKTAPKVTSGKLVALLARLKAGKPVSFAENVSEACTLSATLTLKITTTKRVDAKIVRTTSTLSLGPAKVFTAKGAGAATLTVTLSKTVRAKLVKALRTKQSIFAYDLAVKATDAAKNTATVHQVVRVH